MDELSQAQIQELERDLTALQQQLDQQLDDTADQSKPVQLDQQSIGRVSRIDAIAQQQMAKANRQQNQLLLARVVVALQAISSGDYGYCQQCDEPIGFARLKVQADCVLCIQCQASSE